MYTPEANRGGVGLSRLPNMQFCAACSPDPGDCGVMARLRFGVYGVCAILKSSVGYRAVVLST